MMLLDLSEGRLLEGNTSMPYTNATHSAAF
jgi:hypothetical protein